MKKTLALGIVLLAILAAIFAIENPFSASPIVEQTSTSGLSVGTDVGFQAPSFKLKGLNIGEFEASNYRGKPVVVNFWATWCPYCVSEMPVFERIHREYGDKIVIVGINRAESVSRQTDFLSNELPADITYPLLLDSLDSVARAYGVVAMPTTFFLDEDGVIVKKKIGELTYDEMNQIVTEVLEAGSGQS